MAAQFPSQQTEPLFLQLSFIFKHQIWIDIKYIITHCVKKRNDIYTFTHTDNIPLSSIIIGELKEFAKQDGCKSAVVMQLIS